MSQTKFGRRDFLTSAGIGAASASVNALVNVADAEAQQAPQAPAAAPSTEGAGYTYLKPSEAAFVEAVVDHMIPQDELTSGGTDLGIATYIDRRARRIMG